MTNTTLVSNVRNNIILTFEELPRGDAFALVNTHMNGVVPDAPVFQKTGDNTAINIDTLSEEIIRPNTRIERV